MEFNKIFAALLIPGIVCLFVTNVVDGLYKPDEVVADYVGSGQANASSAAAAEPDVMMLLASADPAKGKLVANSCTPCHNASKGGANKIGPNLWNIVGAQKASSASFKYSKAMLSLTGVWTEQDLATYLKSPQRFAPGTRMSFAGIAKNQDLANLIAYLKTLNDNNGAKP